MVAVMFSVCFGAAAVENIAPQFAELAAKRSVGQPV